MSQALPRYKKIMLYLEQNDTATINSLAQIFMVSHMSIRRDLKQLQEKGLVKISYGGEVKRRFLQGTPLYDFKSERCLESKKIIAQKAMKLLEPGMVVFLDGGTTIREFSRLINNIPLTVITLDLYVALELYQRPEIKTIICPGELQTANIATYNTETMKYLAEQVIDMAFIGADGFSLQDGALTTNQVKADCKWMAIARAIESTLLVDSSKLGLRCRYKISNLDKFNYIVTEKCLPIELQKKLIDSEINLVY